MLKSFSLLDWVIGFQGLYYLFTGLWPFIHFESFESFTGPKGSDFLLHVVSALIIVIAVTLLSSIRRDKLLSILILATLTPIAFMLIEIIYRAQIEWVYFLDFGIEAVILASIIYGYIRSKKPSESLNEAEEKHLINDYD